jgi:2',3'-cyclic-nucleotide 2'-phosphodiesterase (5'-nucleotidase family)
VQAYSRGTAIGVIDVPLGTTTDTARVELRNVEVGGIEPNPIVERIVEDEVLEVREYFAAPVATLSESMHRGLDGLLGNLIADAQRSAGRGDVAIVNRGGVRTDLPAGAVTLGDVFNVAPFENRLVRIRVTGQELRAYLSRIISRPGNGFHLSGVRLEVDTMATSGKVLNAVLSNGNRIEDRQQYVLVMSDFLAEGGDALGLEAASGGVEATSIIDRDALADYLRSRPQPVLPPKDPRIIYRK